MQTRPRIKLPVSPFDKTVEWVSKLLLIVMWVFTVYIFSKLPAIIPIHFDAVGKADYYGKKGTLFILPALSTIIYLGLSQLNKYPHLFNYPVKITGENAEKQYRIATTLLREINLAIQLIVSAIILLSYLSIIRVTNGLGSWFLPVSVCLIFVPTIIAIYKSTLKSRPV